MMKTVLCALLFSVSIPTYCASFIGIGIFNSKHTERHVIPKDMRVDFGSCTVMNGKHLLVGECHKLSSNLIAYTTQFEARLFTRDGDGKIITAQLRDTSYIEKGKNYRWSTSVVGSNQ